MDPAPPMLLPQYHAIVDPEFNTTILSFFRDDETQNVEQGVLNVRPRNWRRRSLEDNFLIQSENDETPGFQLKRHPQWEFVHAPIHIVTHNRPP